MPSFKIKGKVEGLADLLKTLEGVERKAAQKVVRKAVGEAGKLILKRAKQLAPKETGLLKKSLGRKVKVYRNSGVAVAVVGPRKATGFRQTVVRSKNKRRPVTLVANPVKYAHLAELGTVRSRAFPFLKPAVDGQQAAVREAMAAVIKRELERLSGHGD